MVRHTTSTGASIRTSRSIMRPGISIRSFPEHVGGHYRSRPVSATKSSTSREDMQPTVADCSAAAGPPNLQLSGVRGRTAQELAVALWLWRSETLETVLRREVAADPVTWPRLLPGIA